MFLFQIGSIRSAETGNHIFQNFEFLFQIGSIRRHRPGRVGDRSASFLFQIGSIRSPSPRSVLIYDRTSFYSRLVRLEGSTNFLYGKNQQTSFYSRLVRLEVKHMVLTNKLTKKFLFQIGSIRRKKVYQATSSAHTSFYSRLVRLEVSSIQVHHGVLEGVSIPDWFDQKEEGLLGYFFGTYEFLFQIGSIRSVLNSGTSRCT